MPLLINGENNRLQKTFSKLINMRETISKNELLHCCQKSMQARGMATGADWESAAAVCWLETRGLCGLAMCLQDLDDARLNALPTIVLPAAENNFSWDLNGNSPLFCGGAVTDYLAMRARKNEVHGTLKNVRHPVFLSPFAARWRRRGLHCSFTWSNAGIVFSAAGITGLDAINKTVDKKVDTQTDINFCCRFIKNKKITADKTTADDGLQVDGKQWRRLKQWAAKTLEPTNEKESQQNAGAQTSDND